MVEKLNLEKINFLLEEFHRTYHRYINYQGVSRSLYYPLFNLDYLNTLLDRDMIFLPNHEIAGGEKILLAFYLKVPLEIRNNRVFPQS